MATQICRHIRTCGRRCAAFSLKGEQFCYYHLKSGQRHRAIQPPPPETAIAHRVSLDGRELTPMEIQYYTPPKAPFKLDLPPLEDRESIQVALSMLILALAQERIDPKRAAPLLYGLQVASANAKGLSRAPSEYEGVRETVLDDTGEQIAPDADPPMDPLVKEYLDSLDLDDDDEEEDDEEYEYED